MDFLIVILFIFLLIETFINKALIANTISFSLKLFVDSIIPSMFLVFVISDVLINYHITNYIPRIVKKTFMFLFNVSEEVVTVFFLSLLSGFPNGARIIRTLYLNGTISKIDANRALLFTHFSNPIFILSIVGILFLHNEKYGFIILISHYMGNIIIGIISRFFCSSNSLDYTKKCVKSQSFSKIFVSAVKRSIDTLLSILGFVTIFLIMASIIVNRFNFNIYTAAIIKGVLEITMGLKSIADLDILDIYKVVSSSVIISFGGLSVHLQILEQIMDTDLSYHLFFVTRIIHATISGVICYGLFCLLV